MNYKKIILKKDKETSIERFHPWIFSGAIKYGIDDLLEGEIVEIYSCRNEFLGTGFYSSGGSISVRIFSFEKEEINQDFWNRKIQSAYEYRKNIGIIGNPKTNAFRLCHAEGDGIPGLVIDMYAGNAVIQSYVLGIDNVKNEIVLALKETFGNDLKSVYYKSDKVLKDSVNGYLYQDGDIENIVLENGNKFYIDWEKGQKTGFFIDQRENRNILTKYCKDKKVLNTFCYTGGFSVYAANNGAKEVHSVDASQKAMDITDKNIELNNATDIHKSFCSDTFDFLKIVLKNMT
jgi:23S rRNA (cytosine1962-C5)-methyltransferase